MKAYLITCTDVVKDESGQITALHCTYDPDTRGGNAPDGRKVRGTLHWVSAAHGVETEVRLYESLFTKEDPEEVAPGEDFTANLNPASLTVTTAVVEPLLAAAAPGERFQFMRHGYFAVDTVDSTPDRPVYNRTVGLRDSWARAQVSK